MESKSVTSNGLWYLKSSISNTAYQKYRNISSVGKISVKLVISGTNIIGSIAIITILTGTESTDLYSKLSYKLYNFYMLSRKEYNEPKALSGI